MKILMTNDEWNRSGWFPKLVAIITGNIVLFLALGALILLPLFVLYGLTIIPLKIYLAMIVVILLVVVFGNVPRRAGKYRDPSARKGRGLQDDKGKN